MAAPEFSDSTALSISYGESTIHLLVQLSTKASALRSLELALPTLYSHGIFWVSRQALPISLHCRALPLVGTLNQLECLTLSDWQYCKEDLCMFSHLSKLQKLKVPHCDLQPSKSYNRQQIARRTVGGNPLTSCLLPM